MALNLIAYPNLIYIQSSEPADKTAGRLWSDTDDGTLYSANGSAYNVIGAGVPIGTILAWNKSYTNTPALLSGWVECNGQVLSDAESVYDGQTIPNLNGDNRFLRGNSASTTTGGAATHTHLLAATGIQANGNFDFSKVNTDGTKRWYNSDGSENTDTLTKSSDVYTGNAGTLPPYYNIVWIMKIK